jgi:predicted transposase/invertase (TIGR01784 family)
MEERSEPPTNVIRAKLDIVFKKMFNMFKCREFHSHFTVMEKTRHEILTDKCGIHFFELRKISKKANLNDRKELWLQLINAETKEEMAMLEQTGDAPIQKAVYVLHQMSEDERLAEMARIREKSLLDYTSGMNYAKRQGKAEGKAEVAQNLLEMGMPLEQIEKATGLAREEIENLL